MLLKVQGWLNALQFPIRNAVLGRLALRRGRLRVDRSSRQSEAERRFYRRLIEQGIGSERASRSQAVWDIGCRNWSYAEALAESFPAATLTGVELDWGRRYWNLYRRRDAAEAHAAELRERGREAGCVFGDFLEIAPSRFSGALVCFFYPFVSPRPCVKWGLPPRYSDFTLALEHALRGTRRLFSVHQGEWEAELAREAYARVGLTDVSERRLDAAELSEPGCSPHDAYLFGTSP